MKLFVSATSIKNWFQYRCERKLVYETMDPRAREAIPIEALRAPAPWADFGIEFEREVIAAYARESGVRLLAPAAGEGDLTAEMSKAFLEGKTKHTAAHQLLLEGTPPLRAHLQITDHPVDFRRGLVDLVLASERDGTRFLRLVDIKSTHEALPFHKTQLAWYSLMLNALLEHLALKPRVALDPVGEIWHRPRASTGASMLVERSPFRLRNYEAVILDWAGRELRQAIGRTVSRERDDTRFHVYFKCEQCAFLRRCEQAISDERKPQLLDLSAIPGISHQSKASLSRRGLRTVGDVVGAPGRLIGPDVNEWQLQTRGRQILERAKALVAQRVHRMPDGLTLRMPPRTDVQIHLVADSDPLAARLASLGAMLIREDGRTEQHIHLCRTHEEEATALRSVLGSVTQLLAEVDEANRAGASRILHLFVYEPAESRDLSEALGRHLDDPEVMRDVIELVRMFPPQDRVPEPEYRGFHHLPACALRSILEETHALPVKVSYDLARVGAALASHPRPPSDVYQPGVAFARPFSARLALNVCRDLAEGRIAEEEVRADVRSRLEAMASIARWLEAENGELPETERFLRLRKAPFRLHQTVDPLRTGGLDLLRAQALLENRASLLQTLDALAQPLARRKERRICIADLELLKDGRGTRGDHWLLFHAPENARDVDINPGDPMLLLSDGSPGALLDPALWPHLRVRLHPSRPEDPPDRLFITMSEDLFVSSIFRDFRSRLGRSGWVLDRGHFDVNTDRLEDFLLHLAEGAR